MPIRYLILSLTSRCNLACRYCYNGAQQTVSDMPVAVIERAVNLAAQDSPSFHLQLTGGEPTFTPKLISSAVALARSTGRCSSIGIQTNATMLTPELLRQFKKDNIQVGVSLDGPPHIQQKLRGKASETYNGLKLLDKEKVYFQITTVVTNLNAGTLDRLVLLLAGFKYVRGIGLDLLVSKGRVTDDTDSVLPADPAALKEGLHRMLICLDAVNARRPFSIRLRERDMIVASKRNPRGAFCHAVRQESMAVTPEGDIFPCGQTLRDFRFAAGTVGKPELWRLKTLFDHTSTNLSCGPCDLNGFCPKECLSRLYYNSHQHPPLACHLYRYLWHYESDQKRKNRKG